MRRKLLFLILGFMLVTGVAWGTDVAPVDSTTATTLSVVDSIQINWVAGNWAEGAIDSIIIKTLADSTWVASTTTGTDDSIQIGGLTQGTAYSYLVFADSAGTQSPPDTVTFTTADITQPAFTMDSSTSTTITCTVVTSPADGDSLIIVTGPDSVAVVWSTTTGIDTTSFTVSGLTPFTQYIWRLKADSANAIRSSDLDTLWTKACYESDFGRPLSQMIPQRVDTYPVLTSQSWKAQSSSETTVRYTSFSLQGTTDTDSSAIMNVAPYTNLIGYASGDSVDFTVLIYSGEFISGASSGEHYEVLVDSINVDAAGAFGVIDSDSEASNLRLPATEHFIIKLRANSGHDVSDAVTVKMWLYRYKD